MFGSLISGGLSLLGGLFGSSQSRRGAELQAQAQRQNNELNVEAQRDINTQNVNAVAEQNALNRELQTNINSMALADKETDRALQREFAQSGIQWRANDARAAGIHPIYALGGSGASYSPSPVSLGVPSQSVATQVAPRREAETAYGAGVAASGQDISRAIHATRSAIERDNAFSTSVQALSLQKLGLENQLLASQIQRLRANSNPPMPTSENNETPVPIASTFEDRPRLMLGNGEIKTDPKFTNAEDFEKRYGEISDWLVGPYILYNDYQHNTGGFSSHARRLANRALSNIHHGMAMSRRVNTNSSHWKGHF